MHGIVLEIVMGVCVGTLNTETSFKHEGWRRTVPPRITPSKRGHGPAVYGRLSWPAHPLVQQGDRLSVWVGIHVCGCVDTWVCKVCSAGVVGLRRRTSANNIYAYSQRDTGQLTQVWGVTYLHYHQLREPEIMNRVTDISICRRIIRCNHYVILVTLGINQ